MSECFFLDTIVTLTEAVARRAFGTVVVAYSPPDAGSEFARLAPADTLLLAQHPLGLGDRLRLAARELFSVGFAAVALLGADNPTVPVSHYEKLLLSLEEDPEGVVLGPAEDGGYYALGMARFYRVLFEDIAWSTERVFQQTFAHAKMLGRRVTLLPRWHDVDEFTDLQRLRRDLDHLEPKRAQHTRAYLDELATRGVFDVEQANPSADT